jgi:transposase
MTKYTTVFANLLRHLSRSDFESAVSANNGDFKVRTLTCFNLFKAMLYGLISKCFSVREIETSMRVNGNRLYHSGLKQIKRSTFCDALEKRPQELFQDVFHKLVEKAQCIAGKTQKKFKNPLRIIDASIISLCLLRFDWAKYRKAKGAIKLHLNLDGDTHIPFDAYLTVGKVHDAMLMQNLTEETGVIYVMDRGYVHFKSLYDIDLRGSFFVTRMKRNCAFKRIKNNPRSKDGPVLSDVLIELTGPATKKQYPKALRKVKYRDDETRKTYEFLTNDMNSPALQIAMIYKERWEVELFFKFIKQHLKIKSFWGTSENAVYSQIWVALILTILLWIARALDGIKASPYELLQMMRAALLTKNTLIGLCTYTPPLKPDEAFLQPFLEGIKC